MLIQTTVLWRPLTMSLNFLNLSYAKYTFYDISLIPPKA